MPQRRKQLKKTLPVAGVIGVSMALAGGSAAMAGVESGPDGSLKTTGPGPEIAFGEEEISDVSLGTFYVFDKEVDKAGQQYARGCGGCRGCRGCARGCRSCRSCGGCGGCSCGCCISWGACRFLC